jgi:hypothetical protein
MNDNDRATDGAWRMSRRTFCGALAGILLNALLLPPFLQAQLREISPTEDLFDFMKRKAGRFDQMLYQRLIGKST